MSQNDDNKNLIDRSELGELDEKEAQRISLVKLIGVILGVLLLLIVHNFYSMIQMWTDDSVAFVQCPKNFDLDKPVILKKLETSDPLSVDNWISSFAIGYTMRLFPRAKQDAKIFYQWIIDHSDTDMRKKYEARMKEISKIEELIDSGSFSRFWLEDSQKIEIRKNSSSGDWIVIINGYLHRKKNVEVEKTQPKVELTISLTTPTIRNPEGLKVEKIRFIQITDPVAGNELDI
jgi:hypothetical protein